MIKELAKVANRLDSVGLTKEADFLDKLIEKIAAGEDQSYYSDRRVTSPGHDVGDFDKESMMITIETDGEDGEPVELELSAKYHECDVCYGKGTHVNPSIDSGGISSDDEFWDEDMDDATGESRYFRGGYDVVCYTCNGEKVIPIVDRSKCSQKDLEIYDQLMEDQADFRSQQESERRSGA